MESYLVWGGAGGVKIKYLFWKQNDHITRENHSKLIKKLYIPSL